MSYPNRFVVTGPPGSGKTTMLSEIEQMGFVCMPEVARQIIQEQVRMGGSAVPWADRRAYTQIMLQRSIESYQQTPTTRPTFADRGIPDTLGYARLIALGDDGAIREACERYRYASPIFVTSPWEEIYETDSERKQAFDEVVRTFHFLKHAYEECGYQLIEIPKAPARERALFVLEHAGLCTAANQKDHPKL
jgi:predicted ATPase